MQATLSSIWHIQTVACRLPVCLIFCSVKVELSHFAPNYFAVNLSDDSCRAVLIQRVTLNLFIDTSNSKGSPLQFTTSQLWHLYDVTEASCHVQMRPLSPLHHQSPEQWLPFFSDLSQDRRWFIKYIISTDVILSCLDFLSERYFVQQKIFQFLPRWRCC